MPAKANPVAIQVKARDACRRAFCLLIIFMGLKSMAFVRLRLKWRIAREIRPAQKMMAATPIIQVNTWDWRASAGSSIDSIEAGIPWPPVLPLRLFDTSFADDPDVDRHVVSEPCSKQSPTKV